ncbi:ADP-ribosylglycohydrolase family protein [Luteibacter sp.]|uniref:ADP-ribosylglycohydrolase family protein n=1 Tax=Luteibacter sp. TaxID=1886636 RepID=UPI003F818A27
MGLNNSQMKRIRSGMEGLLVGDALGVPFEFHDPVEIPDTALIDFEPPVGFDRAHPGVPAGTWSDDGAQALCLLASLLHCDGLDLSDFSRRLVNWLDWGYLAVDGHVFDVGMQTTVALRRLRQGISPLKAGPASVSDNGNGALMRVLPVALWHEGDDFSLVRMASEQSRPTHGHPRSGVACAMYCLWARSELTGSDRSWSEAERRLRDLGPRAGLPEEEIELVLDTSNASNVRGTGYVVDSLWSARFAIDAANDYASAVRRAISLGNDTDTTAAIVGGIAGVRYGHEGIPANWRNALRGRPLFEEILAKMR